MNHVFSWSRSIVFQAGLGALVLAAFVVEPAGAVQKRRPGLGGEGEVPEVKPPDRDKPEKPKVLKKGYCCAKWEKKKDEDGKETQEGKQCRATEDPDKCTAGEILPGDIEGSWNDCAGATAVPDRGPSPPSKKTFSVLNCTPK
jgi:hypothetical protein